MSVLQQGSFPLVKHRFWVTVSLTISALMQTIDSTIANVALPHMRGSLAATQDQSAWILTSYILATAIMMPPSGYLANRFGIKNVLLTCVAGFVLTSVLCGMATSIEQMVLFRFLQGAFGAPTTPIIQAALLGMYTLEERAKSMSIFGFGIMLGPILGPTLGGVLTEFYSWRWVFFINIPLGCLALFGMLVLIPRTARQITAKFDWFGFGMLSLSFGAIQLALDRGQSQNWFASNEILGEFIIAGLGFYLFIVHMLTFEHPFIEAKLFRDRNFVAGIIFAFFASSTMMGVMALLPVYLQNLLNIPVLTSGFLMAPRGIATLIMMLLIPRIAKRADPRLMLLCGVIITALAMHKMARFTLEIDRTAIIVIGLMQGAGIALMMVPNSILLFSTLDRRYATEASSIFNLLRNIGGSLCISIMIALMSHNSQVFHAELAQTITPFRDATQATALPPAWDWRNEAGAMTINSEVSRQASAIALFGDFSLMQWVSLLSAPLVLLFSRQIVKSTREDEHLPLIE